MRRRGTSDGFDESEYGLWHVGSEMMGDFGTVGSGRRREERESREKNEEEDEKESSSYQSQQDSEWILAWFLSSSVT